MVCPSQISIRPQRKAYEGHGDDNAEFTGGRDGQDANHPQVDHGYF